MIISKWMKGISKGWMAVIAASAGVSGACYSFLYAFSSQTYIFLHLRIERQNINLFRYFSYFYFKNYFILRYTKCPISSKYFIIILMNRQLFDIIQRNNESEKRSKITDRDKNLDSFFSLFDISSCSQ